MLRIALFPLLFPVPFHILLNILTFFGLCFPLLSALAASGEFPTLTIWFSYIMASSRVDHKDETDGKRNLDCAGKGLFITHSSRRTAGGPPERRNHRATRLVWSPGFVLLLYRVVFGSGKRWCFPVARVRMLITALKIKNFYVYVGGFSLVKAAQHFFDPLRTLSIFKKWKWMKFKEVDFGTCEHRTVSP